MKSNTFYEKMFLWGAGFILLLPVIILPPSFQPSEWSRAILFRIALTILIAIIVFGYFHKKDISLSLPKWNLKDYLPFLLLSSYLFFVILSTIFSKDPRFSFFNSPDRAGGSLSLLFYFVFSLFLAIFLNDNIFKKLWNIAFVAAFLASLLAIVQSLNLLKDIFVSYGGTGVPSFLGNSTFLAIYMLFMALWALVLLIKEPHRKKKILYGILFFLFLLTIFISGSRATYLALVLSLFFFLFFFPTKKIASAFSDQDQRIITEIPKETKRGIVAFSNNMLSKFTQLPLVRKIKTLKIIAGSLLLFAVILVLLFNLIPGLGESNRVFNILADRLSIATIAKDLFGTRLAVWQITWKAIQDKPWFGWGPENFYIGFEKYYEPTIPDFQKLWWDRPHNLFLDIFVNYGVFALISYLAFWGTVFWSLQRYKKRASDEKNVLAAHGLQTMFIGYLLIQFFNFDSFPTYLTLFFFIGYTFYLLSSEKEQHVVLSFNLPSPIKNIGLGVFSILLILFLFFWHLAPLYNNERIIHAKNISNNPKKCEQALETMDLVQRHAGIIRAHSALIYSDVIKRCATGNNEVEYARKGFEALQQASIYQPYYTRTWIFMGSFKNVLAAREENSATKNALLEEARGYFKKALELSPKRQEIYVEMEKSYLVAEDYQSMKNLAQYCIAIDQSQGVCYWYFGIAEIFMGDQAPGKLHIDEALAKGGFTPQYVQLGAAYINQNNYKDASEVYHYLTSSYPDNVNYHAVMAFLSRELGDYERALNEALKVFLLQPENPEAVPFIEALLAARPNDPSFHASMAYVYQRTGQTEKARRELVAARDIYLNLIANNPGVAALHIEIAVIYKELQDLETAYRETLLAFQLEPNYKEKIEKFIQTFPDEMQERYYLYNQLISGNHTLADNHLELAIKYKLDKKYQEAYDELILALKLQPSYEDKIAYFIGTFPQEYVEKFENYRDRQELLAKKVKFTELIATDPDNIDYHVDMALTYQGLGEYENARQEALTILRLASELDKPDYKKRANEIINSLPN